MSQLKLYNDAGKSTTLVANRFIDEYLKDANDAQIKVYLFLLRTFQAGETISVTDIADQFNHTEKDVLRALKYWEKNKLLCLDYDEDKTLVGIRIKDITGETRTRKYNSVTLSLSSEQELTDSPEQKPYTDSVHDSPQIPSDLRIAPTKVISSEIVPENSYTKPVYTASDLTEFKNRSNTGQLLMVAEQYIGKQLSVSDMKSILFFTDVLDLSDDLIDYLIQYCVDLGKRDFKYIEKVAVSWAEHGIHTPEEAKNYANKYNKTIYGIMNALGKNSAPTAKELEFINRWTKEFDFTVDIILEACERTVLATDKHRFEYADGILTRWHNDNVRYKSDIEKRDTIFRQKKKNQPATAKPASNNKFNQFTQNEYDFEALEQKLISN